MTRLQAAFELIDFCDVFADIGCDHGKLCKAVIDSGKAKKVIAADISEDSLKKAKSLLGGYENVEFKACDGTDEGRLKADVMAICGLGGLTIKNILRFLPRCALVLSPQDHAGELRRFLSQNGYAIVKDFVVKDGKRYYDILKAVPGNCSIDENQIEYGAFCYEKQPILKERLEYLYKKLIAYPDTEENIKKIKMITELLNWQR